jgi:hypothetical protein
MVSTPPTKDQRRSPRYRHDLVVELHEKQRTRKLHAVDVGRHGLFLVTDDPPHERHLVQLTVHLPEGPIKAAASVMRTIKHDARVDGVGVQFFALSGDAKQRWDDFIFALQRTTPPMGVPLPALAKGMESPPNTDPEHRARSTPSTVTSQPPTHPHPPATTSLPPQVGGAGNAGATFLVKLKSVERLKDFAETHLKAGGTVLFTPVLRAEGEVVTLIVVHPKTDEEFRLPGFVAKAHSDRPKRLDIHFYGITPAVVESFNRYVDTGHPPAVQLEAPRPLVEEKDDDFDLDVEFLDDLNELDEIDVHPDEEDVVWREPGDLTGPIKQVPASPPPAPPKHAVDPGLKPTTFLVRCDHEGDGCSSQPYAIDLGPCRGVLGLVADHSAFLSNRTGRVVTAPRFVSTEERAKRAKDFADKGGKLNDPVDVQTLLSVAALAGPVKDPDSGQPLKHTRAVERLEHAALRLEDGAEPAKTKVGCPDCKEGHLTIERVKL